jgi:hypothetical protein
MIVLFYIVLDAAPPEARMPNNRYEIVGTQMFATRHEGNFFFTTPNRVPEGDDKAIKCACYEIV